jgi:serine/threonine-protein kinase
MNAHVLSLLDLNGEPVSAIGDIVDDKYEIRRELGRGAGGVVYEAVHTFTGRTVALKMLAPDAPREAFRSLSARLLVEGRALAAVNHPGVVDILDAGVTPTGPYVALEMLRGRTLDDLLVARGKMGKDDAIAVALQLADALAATHAAGIVHRDVKPANVFIIQKRNDVERVKLVDFGIAHLRRANDPKLTSVGAVLGTPEYMAPEQLVGCDDIDARADIYALGVTLFECLTGNVPYQGDYDQMLRVTTRVEKVPSVLALCPEAGAAVAAVVEKAIARRRDDRFASASEFARALRAAAPTVRPKTTLLKPQIVRRAGRNGASTASEFEPQRRSPRAPYATPALVFTPWSGVEARIAEISMDGALLLSAHGHAIHDRIRVRFALPITGELVTVTAEVRWVGDRQAEGGARPMGLELLDVPARARASIESYVELMNDSSHG